MNDMKEICCAHKHDESLVSEYAVSRWGKCKEAAEYAVTAHSENCTKRRKIILSCNESMRYKAGAIGYIQALEDINVAVIEKSKNFVKVFANKKEKFEIKRNEKTLSALKKIFGWLRDGDRGCSRQYASH